MYDSLDKTGLKTVLEAVKDKMPTSLPANGGNADTVDGYHIRCEDVATPKYNWFATFDNDSLSGINPERAYVGNAGNAITANTVKTMSVIGTVSNATHNSVLDWANSVNGFGTACLIVGFGYPSDAPIQAEGFFTVETCYQNSRRYVTFKTYDGTKIYERTIWANEWMHNWSQIKAGNADYAADADKLDGLHADDFVNANDRDQIQIPSNANVPVWIHTNGKRFRRYMTNAGNIGLTNVPDNSNDYVWYWYDGLNILARDWSSGKYYICDMINGAFSGWKDVYTSGYKPYETGSISVSYSAESQNFEFLNFTPSAVICKYASRYENDGTIKWATPITNGFKVTINSADTKTLEFIAFR